MLGLSVIAHSEEKKEPQDLTNLRDSYQKAIERAIAPVEGKYIEELKKLKLRYTQAGKLEEAIVVDKELTTMLAANEKPDSGNGKPGAANDPERLIGEWYCNDVETDIYMIKSGKKALHASDAGTWATDDTALIITWANGFKLVIDLNQKGDVIQGRSYPPGSTRYDMLKFTRRKGS